MFQLELNLPHQTKEIPRQTWEYSFNTDALVERHEGKKVVYGLWDKLFGCWIVDEATGRSQEVVPTWRPLNTNGVWRDQKELRFPLVGSDKTALCEAWRYEANTSFAAYFSSVPLRRRSLVAPLKHYQWLALDMIWQVPAFADFLDEEFYNGAEQYLYACFSLAKAERFTRTQRRNFAKTLMSKKRSHVLGMLSGRQCQKKTLRTLKKLGRKFCSEEVYEFLVETVSGLEFSKPFVHARSINPALLEAVISMPREFCRANIVNLILSQEIFSEGQLPEDVEWNNSVEQQIMQLYDLFRELPNAVKSSMLSSLGAVRSAADFFRWAEKWEGRIIELLGFPVPPFKEQSGLTPLSSPAAMKREALRMKNCLTSMIADVVVGEVYFYHYEGKELATVQIAKISNHDWGFHKALGHENQSLSGDVEASIQAIVQRAGACNTAR